LSYNPNGGAVPEDPDPPLTDNTSQDSGAAWSPDGSQIAFVSERDGDLDIWAMKPVPETNNIGNNFPRISPTTAAAEHSTPTRPGRRIYLTAPPG
jgi:Tol biopolymer transport system component